MAEEKKSSANRSGNPDPATNSKDFFISYNGADKTWAEWIAWQLEEAGFSTILQAWDFRPGANFVLKMQEASAKAKRTIAILSPNYLRADFTQPEWVAAFRRDPQGSKGILVPVMVRDCRQELEGLWLQIIYINLVGLTEQTARKAVLEGINRDRNKPETPPVFPGVIQHNEIEEPHFPGNSTGDTRNSHKLIESKGSSSNIQPTISSDAEQENRVLMLLRRENVQNLKILDDFWRQVNECLKDYPLLGNLQKYHRLAYNILVPWTHLVWESHASLLPLVDEKAISRMYELNQNLDFFVLLRKKIQDVFDTDENKKLWNDLITWMKAYYGDDLKQREEAQHGTEGRELDRRAFQFSDSLTPLWNAINTLYQSIHNVGNPIL